MLNVECKADPTQTTASAVLAEECVDHIVAAAPALPAVAIPSIVLPESVVSQRQNAQVLHTFPDALLIKGVCSETDNFSSGENHVPCSPVQSCVVDTHDPDEYAMSQGDGSEAVGSDFVCLQSQWPFMISILTDPFRCVYVFPAASTFGLLHLRDVFPVPVICMWLHIRLRKPTTRKTLKVSKL